MAETGSTCEYCLPQTKHVKQLELLWTSSCRFSVRLCMYSLPQMAQLYIDLLASICKASRLSSAHNSNQP